MVLRIYETEQVGGYFIGMIHNEWNLYSIKYVKNTKITLCLKSWI